MTDRIAEFVRDFRAEWPTARIEVDEFPSGAVYLDVYIAARHFLLRYFPESSVFGVDEVLPDEGFLEKYALISPSAEVATEYLRGLVNEAICSANGTTATAPTRSSTV